MNLLNLVQSKKLQLINTTRFHSFADEKVLSECD